MYNRYDLLAPVHKGLRYALGGLIVQAGSMNIRNERNVQSFVDEFTKIAGILDAHAQDEDTHLQHLYERFAPETATKLGAEHTALDRDIHEIGNLLEKIRNPLPIEQRRAVWYEINRKLIKFTADYFQHLQREEGEAAGALWAHLDDGQLKELAIKIRSSIAPGTMMIFLHYMIPALNPDERLGMLGGMEKFAPPEDYEAVKKLAQDRLSFNDWEELSMKLEI